MKFYSASYKSFNCSPKKVNEVATIIRKRSFIDALGVLKTNKCCSAPVFSKLLISAFANANYLDKIDSKNLIISEILVNSAGMLKRRKFSARGRASVIRKRLSSVKVTLSYDGDKKA